MKNREKRCCQFCNDTEQNGLEFSGRAFKFGICRDCAKKLILEFMDEFPRILIFKR